MPLHAFIFRPSLWLGEGKITFGASPQFLKFYTKWEIEEKQAGVIKATQTIEMHGIEEQLVNALTLSDIQKNSFKIVLESNVAGRTEGKGLCDERTIAWEFRGDSSFEGFEVYERQETGDYFMHAEYGSPETFRTVIEGLIWLKTP